MLNNQIKQVRPTATFENYVPGTESQQQAYDMMLKVTNSVIGMQDKIMAEDNPFQRANLIFMSGAPGLGKSHLQEAMINKINREAPGVAQQKIYLMRDNFTSEFATFIPTHENGFKKHPIILVDDLFANVSSASDLRPLSDGKAMHNFIMQAYKTKNLVIFSSNFALGDDLERIIAGNDSMGRLQSRLQEISAGNFAMQGEDYRSKTAPGLFL